MRVLALSVLAALLVITAMPWTAAGATAGPEYGTGSDGGGSYAWTNPGNVDANDNSDATRSLDQNQTSNTLWAKDMGFAIPSDATITGILVSIGRDSTGMSSPLIRDNTVRLTKDGSGFEGDNKAVTDTNWPGSEGTANYGSSADLWGTTWTPAEINAATFGVGLRVFNGNSFSRTASVDYMRITVSYAEPGGPNMAQTAVNENPGGGAAAWSNPGNVSADDGTAALADVGSGSTSQYLNATGFSFSIPASATINGVTVRIDRQSSGMQTPFIQDHTVQLIKGGSRAGDNKAVTGTNWPNGSYAVATYGSTSDTWGTTLTPADLNASTFGVSLRVSNPNGSFDRDASVDFIEVTVDYDLDPRVAVEQATAQVDPTNVPSMDFDVTFNKDVTGVDTGDFTVGGTATGFAVDSVTGSGADYSVTVTGTAGVATDGTVMLSMPAGGAEDSGARLNHASTSVDNSVTYDSTQPTVTVEVDPGQADPTKVAAMDFDVVFSEDVTGLEAGDFTVGGTATGFAVDEVTGSGATYSVSVTGTAGVATDGTVTLSLPAAAVEDAAGNTSEASTSSDNSVIYDTTADAVTGLYVTSYTPTSVGIAWDAASDVSGVAAYLVSRTGSSDVATITGTALMFDGLTEDTSYTFSVKTVDALDNVSAPAAITKTTPAVTLSSDVTTDSPVAQLMTDEGEVVVTFDEVTTAGTFYLTKEPSPPADYKAGSTWIRLGDMSYEAHFTGSFTGQVTVKMPYSPLLPDTRARNIKVRHRVGTAWETITPAVSILSRTVTFKLDSLSPLVLVEPASASRDVNLAVRFGGQSSSVKTLYPAHGKTLTLLGTVTDSGGVGVANKTVKVQRLSGGAWVDVAQASAIAKGVYAYQYTAGSKMIYRFYVVADAYTKGRTSASYTVYPKVKVALTSAPTSVKVNKSFTLKGTLVPKHAAGSKLTLQFLKYVNGKYKLQYSKTVSVKDSGASSAFSNSFKISKSGTWRVRILSKADSEHATTYSASKKIKVKK